MKSRCMMNAAAPDGAPPQRILEEDSKKSFLLAMPPRGPEAGESHKYEGYDSGALFSHVNVFPVFGHLTPTTVINSMVR